MTSQPGLQPKHRAAILFGIAGVLLIGLFTRNWVSADDGGLGLSGMKHCRANDCIGMSWFDAPHVPVSIILVATLGIVAGLLAVAFLAHAAAMVLQGRAQQVQPGRVMSALGLTLAVGAIFMIRIFLESHAGLHVGWSSIVALLACVAGLVAVAKLVEPLRATSVASQVVQAYSVGAPPPAQGGVIRGYPLSMQLGMNRMHGHLFLAPGRLYFLCVKQGGAWLAVAGAALGGAVGGALAGLATSGAGAAPQVFDEATLHRYATQMPGSVVMEAPQIQEIKQTIWWRLIRANGQKFGLPHGLGGDLKAALGPWARHHQVKTVGFA
ncbi:MAG TPA: hypothetical protein VFQ65_17155 [Kofleriaceae bacterium]|nr:hypothetical protein [Kofleriaceae bacterium]